MLNTGMPNAGTGFYGSNDPTNSVKALKEAMSASLAMLIESDALIITDIDSQAHEISTSSPRHRTV